MTLRALLSKNDENILKSPTASQTFMYLVTWDQDDILKQRKDPLSLLEKKYRLVCLSTLSYLV